MKQELDLSHVRVPELWAQLSHDLRQPMQSLQLLVHVATTTNDGAVRQRTLAYMAHGLQSLQDMVEATGLLARLEAGQAMPMKQTAALAELLADAEGRAGASGNLTVRGERTEIEGDRALLSLALRGLVGMAASISDDARVQVSGRRTKGAVTITCAYRGAPLHQGWRKAYFADLPPVAGQPASIGQTVPGVLFIARLAAVMGWTVDISDGPKGAQKLVLSKAIAPANADDQPNRLR